MSSLGRILSSELKRGPRQTGVWGPLGLELALTPPRTGPQVSRSFVKWGSHQTPFTELPGRLNERMCEKVTR